MKKFARKPEVARPKPQHAPQPTPQPTPPPKAPTPPANRLKRDWLIYMLLFGATLAAYWQIRAFGFVNFDDTEYVVDNPHVRDGITPGGIVWAFTSTQDANWFPLTRLSHMLDVQLFGLDAGAHHLVNVVLHALTAVLLFILLDRLTAARWRSLFVAAVFALHPLHVESVAWISERKDVLSSLFWILTTFAYASWVRKPQPLRYGLIVAAFCLGLMSKPMLVTLPFALVLLDFWPLKRVDLSDRPRLLARLREKIPLFALAFAAAVWTYIVQRQGGAMQPFESVPLLSRLGNAALSYFAYLRQTLWPTRMAILYPYPDQLSVVDVALAAIVLAAISWVVYRARRDAPYLAVGWLWFLGTLAPVIGLVQVGFQARADRYVYIPMIGIAVMLAWGLYDATRNSAFQKALAPAAAVACIALWILTAAQASTWRDGETLFRHAIAVTDGNYLAHNNLGFALRSAGRLDDASVEYRTALQERPSYTEAHTNLAEVHWLQGRLDDAISESREAIRLNPRFVLAHINLGAALATGGMFDEAAAQYREALRLAPANVVARVGLGLVLAQLGRRDEGVALLQEAVRLRPDYANGHAQLGNLLGTMNRQDEAIAEFVEAIRLNPGDAHSEYNLGLTLGTKGRFQEAIGAFQRALEINPKDAESLVGVANGQASLRQFDAAIQTYQKALKIDPNNRRAAANLERAAKMQQESQAGAPH